MNLMSLMATLGLDSSGFEKGVKGAESSGQQLANKLEGYFKKAIAALAIGTIAKKLADFAKIGYDYNKQIENLTANFEVLLGSTTAATQKIEQLKTMAAKTPFGLSDLAEATQKLLSYSVAAGETNDILAELGDIALGDKNKLQTLAEVFGKISSFGRLQGQDLKQLIQVGFNPLNEIIKRTGETYEEAEKRMSEGKITLEEVKQAFKDATSEGGMYYQGTDIAAKTITGQLSTLKDNWAAFWGQIMEPVNEQVSGKILQALINGLQKVSDALFGTGEEAEEMRKKLWGEDEEGNAVDPGANLANWLTELMQTWTDGIAEDNETVDGFVNTFKENTKLIKDALSERYANAVDEEEKTAIAAQIEEIKGYETEVEELLQKRAGGYITEEEEARLNTILSTLQQMTAETEAAAGIDKVQSSWEKLVNTGGDKLASAITSVTSALAWFLSDDGATARGIAGIVLGFMGAMKAVNLFKAALIVLKNTNPIYAIAATVLLIATNWDTVKTSISEAAQVVYEKCKEIYGWLDKNILAPIKNIIEKVREFLGLKKQMEPEEGAAMVMPDGTVIPFSKPETMLEMPEELKSMDFTPEDTPATAPGGTNWLTGEALPPPEWFTQTQKAAQEATTDFECMGDAASGAYDASSAAWDGFPDLVETQIDAPLQQALADALSLSEALAGVTSTELPSGRRALGGGLGGLTGGKGTVNLYIDGKKLATTTAGDTKRAQATFNRRTALGYGQ